MDRTAAPRDQHSEAVRAGDLARSSYYYEGAGESDKNLRLMRLLDEQYTKTPYYGIRRMTAWLQAAGHEVNHKHVARILRLMGLEAIYPKRRLSQGGPGHKIYPYLLNGLRIGRPNQVWGTDITYIRLRRDSSTSWQSWTGTAGMCWPGRSP